METTGLATKQYNGYELEVSIYNLEEKEVELLDGAIYLVENKASLLETSKNCLITKSTLHRHIHKKLPYISPELYRLVVLQFEENMANRAKVRWERLK